MIEPMIRRIKAEPETVVTDEVAYVSSQEDELHKIVTNRIAA
jgi:hypothetical protein